MDDRHADGQPRTLDALERGDAHPAERESLAAATGEPLGGDQPTSRRACHVCLLPQEYAAEIERLRFRGGADGPEPLAAIADRITELLEADGVTGFIITKPKLSRHFRAHGAREDQARYAVQVAARTGRPLAAPKGVPTEMLSRFQAALDPALPISDTYANLASLIRRGAETLGRLERRLDNMLDETLGVDHPTALAAHGYLLNVLRSHYVTLHKLSDPRRTVMVFLAEVAHSMMEDVVRESQEAFGALARDVAPGLEPTKRDQVQAAVVNRGRAFASSLDEVAEKYDTVLASLASGDLGD